MATAINIPIPYTIQYILYDIVYIVKSIYIVYMV